MAVAEGEWILESEQLFGGGRVGAKDDADVCRRVRFVEARLAEERGRRVAEADADEGRWTRREVAEHREQHRTPERKVAPGLVRTDGRIEAAQGQRGVEEQHSRGHPTVCERAEDPCRPVRPSLAATVRNT